MDLEKTDLYWCFSDCARLWNFSGLCEIDNKKFICKLFVRPSSGDNVATKKRKILLIHLIKLNEHD